MPARWLRWIIVLFWLGTTGWLFSHDLWPRWRPGEPPPLRPDDVDEVQSPTKTKIFWTVLRQADGRTEPIFRATTGVEYHPEDDTYTLYALLDAARAQYHRPVLVSKAFQIDNIASEYRVNRAGNLHSLRAEVKVTPQIVQRRPEWDFFLRPLLNRPASPDDKKSAFSDPIFLRLRGEVRENQFFAQCSAEGKILNKPIQFDLPPTPVSRSGSVIMPLHPINHIRGLSLGQTWRQAVVDPLRDAFSFLPGFAGGVHWLNAQILPQPQLLTLDDNETSCFVIEYSNDENEIVGRTWVEQESDRVLQQEAILEDGHWIMKREFERRSGKRLPPP